LIRSWIGKSVFKTVRMIDSPLLSGTDLESTLRARGFPVATPANLGLLSARERQQTVVVVQDAFTSYFETQLVIDTFELLKLLGFQPYLAPYRPNGKPLHVHGFLERFEKTVEANGAMLRQLSSSGVALIGIDPSMTLTYRAEYTKVLGDRAVRVELLQEWLAPQLGHVAPSELARPEFWLLPHCTEKTNAVTSIGDWQSVFAALHARLEIVAAGCCGMAGTYGHEAEHLSTSAAIYRQSWGNHLSKASPRTMLATGYSCRSQVKRLDGVTLLHPIQALLKLQRARNGSSCTE
jgi:Fe-S oxidoreductase